MLCLNSGFDENTTSWKWIPLSDYLGFESGCLHFEFSLSRSCCYSSLQLDNVVRKLREHFPVAGNELKRLYKAVTSVFGRAL